MSARSFAALALAAAVALPSSVALAQQPAAPAAAVQVSPEHLAIARQVVDASGAAATFENVIPSFIEQAKGLFLPTNPDLQRPLNEVGDQLKAEFQPRVQELIQSIAVVYTQRFTIEELRRFLAFYQSPDGRKLVTVLPQILEESYGRSQQWSQVVTRDLVTRFREEFAKRGIRL